MTLAYDIEVYKNIFTATFVDMDKTNDKAINDYIVADINNDTVTKNDTLSQMHKEVFVINEEVNDVFKLRDFLSLKPTLIGFNNQGYDDIILALLMDNIDTPVDLLTELLYDASNTIISYSFISRDDELYKYKYQTLFPSIDLQKLYHLKYKGLKIYH